MVPSKRAAYVILIVGVLSLFLAVQSGIGEKAPEKAELVDQHGLTPEERVNKQIISSGVEHDVTILEHGSYDTPGSGWMWFVLGIRAVNNDGTEEIYAQTWHSNPSYLPIIGEKYDLYYDVRDLKGQIAGDSKLAHLLDFERIKLISGYKNTATGEIYKVK